MNCIPSLEKPICPGCPTLLDRSPPAPGRALARPHASSRLRQASVVSLIACGMLFNTSCSASEPPPQPENSDYQLNYTVTPEPQKNRMRVKLNLSQSRPLLLEMRLEAPPKYFSDFAGDGDFSRSDDRLIWLAPEKGGELSWVVSLNRQKGKHRYDAYMTADWALFRASDIIPPASSRTIKNATGQTTLSFSLPAGWSSVTEYAGKNHTYVVDNPKRRFDRPTGWILLGDVGTRLETIAGTLVKVAAPKNHGVRRMDMLAFLAWTLPEVSQLFQDFPERLTIISANEPLWRGGLSAPSSLFISASLPLISENGTSTLLHELIHIGMGISAETGADWIIEGLAEYYSLKLLLRSGTISRQRFDRSLASLDRWGNDADVLCLESASGAITAKSTSLMHALDDELYKTTEGKYNLDDVMSVLANREQKITIASLTQSATRLLGGPSDVLDNAGISDCTS